MGWEYFSFDICTVAHQSELESSDWDQNWAKNMPFLVKNFELPNATFRKTWEESEMKLEQKWKWKSESRECCVGNVDWGSSARNPDAVAVIDQTPIGEIHFRGKFLKGTEKWVTGKTPIEILRGKKKAPKRYTFRRNWAHQHALYLPPPGLPSHPSTHSTTRYYIRLRRVISTIVLHGRAFDQIVMTFLFHPIFVQLFNLCGCNIPEKKNHHISPDIIHNT